MAELTGRKSSLVKSIEKRWYSRAGILYFLLPLEWLFKGLSARRKRMLAKNAYRASKPVVIVGNVAVGGTGKTPLIIALVNHLREAGITTAVVSRGYGSSAARSIQPVLVTTHHTYSDVGDEPLEIFQRSGCPVVVGGDRISSVKVLEGRSDVDVIFCDDGLQYYALDRDIEIVVIDGRRGWGNGHCLPVGPMREKPSRVKDADFCILNGENADIAGENVYSASIKATGVVNLESGELFDLQHLNSFSNLVAVSGIGNPNKFYSTLKDLSLSFTKLEFSDHYAFELSDFKSLESCTKLMTGKDAVKCKSFADKTFWSLEVDMMPDAQFIEKLITLLKSKLSTS